MKHLNKFLFAIVILGLTTVNGQDKDNPWLIGLGVNAVDVYPTNEPGQGKWFDEYFNVEDHWNILPSVSRINVGRYLGDGFTLDLAVSLNKIDKWGDATADDLTYLGLDGSIKYDLNTIFGGEKFDPYIYVGGGYTWIDWIGAGTLNGGLGFNYWFSDNIGLNVQSGYKHSFEDYLAPHFQHSMGIAVKFGGKDTDGDGIYDKDDACPTEAGIEEFNGCPDTDNDGITDAKDSCPTEAGLAKFNGCPDTDGDGIADKDDNCPKVKGVKALAGCPDADGDGITDADDKCPTEAGPVSNNGCPILDKDGDGILDKDDECPDVPGIAELKGCPKPVAPTVEERAELDRLARTVYFNSGRSTFKDETTARLSEIAAIMRNYPNSRFHIEGHTDSTGSAAGNFKLSSERAAAVMNFLIAQGVGSSQLSSQGYGEEQPIESNKTRAGRAANRRVEIKLVK